VEPFKIIHISEPALIDEAKYEHLLPDDEKILDVAVRFKGDHDRYVHEPENFADRQYKPVRNKLPPGVYPFTIVFKYYGGRSNEFKFKIVNKERDSPDFLSLEKM